MIIDLVNYTLYDPGAEARILFTLHESGLRVPRFFCVTEDYDEEDIDAYFAMHFQDVLQYHIRITASVKDGKTSHLLPHSSFLPAYTNVKKYELYRYANRMHEETDAYREQLSAETGVSPEKIVFHLLIMEAVSFTQFGRLESDNPDGILNETRILVGSGLDANFKEQEQVSLQICFHDDDRILYYHQPEGVPMPSEKLLQSLEQAARIVKKHYRTKLQVYFFVEEATDCVYALAVRRSTSPSAKEAKGIRFDSRSILNTFYSTTQTPLMVSYIQNMYNKLLANFFKNTSHLFERPYVTPETSDDVVVYINGRLYFCVERWNKLVNVFPTFQKMQNFKNVYAVLHEKNDLRSWLMQRYVSNICRRLIRSDFKRVQENIDELEQKVATYQAMQLEKMTIQELNTCYKMFQNTMTACWHYALLSVLVSRVSIQKLKKQMKHDGKLNDQMQHYQYATFLLQESCNMSKRLRTHVANARKVEQYRKHFLQIQDQLTVLFFALFEVVGERLAASGSISKADDIHYLTIREVRASMCDPSVKWAAEDAQRRRKAYHWFCQLPNYTEMILREKNIGQHEECLTDVLFPTGNGRTQGRPCMPGLVEGDVLVCPETVTLSAEDIKGKILVVKQMQLDLFQLPLQGLILEEELSYDQIAAVAQHEGTFPVISGVCAACSLMRYTEKARMNGWTGEIQAFSAEKETMQRKWAQYRKHI